MVKVAPKDSTKELISHIGKQVSLHSPEELGSALDKLGKAGANVFLILIVSVGQQE